MEAETSVNGAAQMKSTLFKDHIGACEMFALIMVGVLLWVFRHFGLPFRVITARERGRTHAVLKNTPGWFVV